MSSANTLFLRLSGPMQAWGTGSKLQIRRTDGYPSKSGVLGLLLCAMGVDRRSASRALGSLAELEMGVRIDRPGELDWDYHTAGAGVGIRKAEGGVKVTATTKEPETLLSRRQYVFDASFLVALRGECGVIDQAATALHCPAWPIFLGRKCCIPSEPVLAGTGGYAGLTAALQSMPFFPDNYFEDGTNEELDAVIEHTAGSPVPPQARLVYDVPRTLRNPSHNARWIVPVKLLAPRTRRSVTKSPGRSRVNYASEQWRAIRRKRLQYDNALCVLCKSPAEDVHHVTYERAGQELVEDLRSLCRICHDACTQLEYGNGMRAHRIDPSDPAQRDMILAQVTRLLTSRRQGQRRRILENTRTAAVDFLSDAAG